MADEHGLPGPSDASEASPGRRLRQAWQERTIAIPGVFNPLAAKIAAELGFAAIYLSGGALSAATGVPDVGLLTLTEFTDAARAICDAVDLPLLCDADTGFGEAIHVERTVHQFERAGAAGIHLEDQQLPKRCGHLSGKTLVAVEEMVAKIRAAVAARRDPDFVIIARTDARGVTGFDDAVQRARAYLQAGADAIFPEALQSEEEFRRFAEAVPAPLLANNTEFGKSPNLDVATFAEIGYRMVLFPLTAFRSAMAAARDTLRDLAEKGHQRDRLATMMTRQELYDLLGYADYEERDRRYFA